MHDIFTSVGATNATWVWCPYIDIHKFAPIARFYPGDEYVDWTCLDGYNWAKARSHPVAWKTFDQIFASSYRQIVNRIAPSKPMLLAEIASSGGGKAKARWISNMFDALHTKYRRMRGLIWFDQVQQGVSWPLENSPIVTRAFAQGLRQHRIPGKQLRIPGHKSDPPTALIRGQRRPYLRLKRPQKFAANPASWGFGIER